jgi:hypothetical protein
MNGPVGRSSPRCSANVAFASWTNASVSGGVEPALDRHQALGGDVAGLDHEHGICSLREHGADLVDRCR